MLCHPVFAVPETDADMFQDDGADEHMSFPGSMMPPPAAVARFSIFSDNKPETQTQRNEGLAFPIFDENAPQQSSRAPGIQIYTDPENTYVAAKLICEI